VKDYHVKVWRSAHGAIASEETPSLYHYSRRPVKPMKAQSGPFLQSTARPDFDGLVPKYALRLPGLLRIRVENKMFEEE